MFTDDRWRDSYDAWKLATPPEYEEPEGEEDCDEDELFARLHGNEAARCCGCRPPPAFQAEPIVDEIPF
jgi:hypothetical protein